MIRTALLLGLIACLFPSGGEAAEYWVDNRRAEGGDGSQSRPWHRIATANRSAGPGDVVHIVDSGVPYAECINPRRQGTSRQPIVFRGADGEKPLIHGAKCPGTRRCVKLVRDHLRVQDIRCDARNEVLEGWVLAVEATDVRVTDSAFTGRPSVDGFELRRCTHSVAARNQLFADYSPDRAHKGYPTFRKPKNRLKILTEPSPASTPPITFW